MPPRLSAHAFKQSALSTLRPRNLGLHPVETGQPWLLDGVAWTLRRGVQASWEQCEDDVVLVVAQADERVRGGLLSLNSGVIFTDLHCHRLLLCLEPAYVGNWVTV